MSPRLGHVGHVARAPVRAGIAATLIVALTALSVAACSADEGAAGADAPSGVEARVEAWLSQMTLEEKADQMHGATLDIETQMYVTKANERLGIPAYAMIDGPRGVRAGHATTFPVEEARAATWNPELERRVGEAMGLELAAKRGNVLLAPTVNNLRHPRWGRAQETYGEDVVLLAAMGGAFVEGAQRHVLASVKHFAVNSIEDRRTSVEVTVDERTLREVYLRQFESIVKRARPASVMTAYNSVNGHFCSENAHLLRDVLDGEWGFDGFVESDWVLAVHSTVPSALAGLDIEMPSGVHFSTDKLVAAVEDGEIPLSVIDDAVRRILRKKLEFHLDAPEVPPADVVESRAHTDLAREVAREGFVLLKNDAATLPLDASEVHTLAVVGELADAWNLGDTGSSDAKPSWAVTPLSGLRDRLGSGASVVHVASPGTAEDDAIVRAADAAIVVVGLTAADEGENIVGTGDRDTLELSAAHQEIVRRTAGLNPRTVVVLEGGSAIAVAPWIDQVPAVLMAWYAGQEGGHALADVVFGDVSPSGKLPMTFPVSEAQLPPFVNDRDAVVYDYLHGYRYVDANGETPSFPFGFGLSYTTFAYSELRLADATLSAQGSQHATVQVTNTGARAGREVAQLYVGAQGSAVPRAVRELRAFAKVDLAPGETKTVSFDLPIADLAYWDVGRGSWVVEPVRYVVQAGGSSRDLPVSASFDVAR